MSANSKDESALAHTLSKYCRRSLFALACLSSGVGVAAPDGLAFGYGVDANGLSVDLLRASVQWRWQEHWLEAGNWRLDGYWDLSLAHWDNDNPERDSSGLWDIGVTPVLRWREIRRATLSPYVEAGVGAHLLSESSVNPEREFGSAFQFASHLGVGIRLGRKHSYDISYRFQHVSNAGIRKPNDGIEFHELRLGYWF